MSKMISFRCPPDLWTVLAAIVDGHGHHSLSSVIVQVLRQHFHLSAASTAVLATEACDDGRRFEAIAAWNRRIAGAGSTDVRDEADVEAAVLASLTS